MNVLHIDEQRTWRGGEQQASYLIRGLAQRGHTCLIAGRPGTPFLERDHGVPGLIRLSAPFAGEGDLWTAWRIARAVRRHHVDVLHAHTSHAHTMACMARWMARRGKVVVHRRVDFPPKDNALNRWKYRLPDRYVAVCHRVAAVLEDFGVPPSKVTVAHSAIDPARFDVAPLGRAALGVPEGVPLLGNVGALVGHKDQANLLEALPAVLEVLPDLHLVIAGEGDLRPALERQIAELGLERAVTLLGYRTDVPAILRTLDAFVLSSSAEGIGGATIEALACSLPVVATDAGGVGEVIRNEETGLLVPTHNPGALAKAIIRVFKDQAMAARLASAGRAAVHDHFVADTMVEGNLRAYAAVLGR